MYQVLISGWKVMLYLVYIGIGYRLVLVYQVLRSDSYAVSGIGIGYRLVFVYQVMISGWIVMLYLVLLLDRLIKL